MLAFSFGCDAHFHFFDCINCLKTQEAVDFLKILSSMDFFCINCAVNDIELEKTEAFIKENILKSEKSFSGFYNACAIHPFNVSKEKKDNILNLDKIEKLLQNNKIHVLGECGLDFWSRDLKLLQENQKFMLESQLLLAKEYNKSVVLHIRKGFREIADFFPILKQLPSVLFHSFGGGLNDFSFIEKKIDNSFYGFGAALLLQSKKAFECIKNMPQQKILIESDAPFGPFRNFSIEEYSKKMMKIYSIVNSLKFNDFYKMNRILKQNFMLYLKNE